MSYDQSFIPASYYEELPAQQGYNSSSPYVSDDDQFNDIHFGVYDFHDYHGKVLPGKQAIHTQREHVNPFAQVKKEYNEGYTELYFPNLAAEITSYNPHSLGTLTSESDLTTFEPVFPVEEPPMFQPITMPAPIPQAHTFPGHLRPTRVKSTIPDIPLLFSLFDVLQEDTLQNSRPQHFTPKHPHHVQQHMQQLKSVKVKKVPTREFKIFTPPVPRHVSQGLAQALRH